MPFNAILFVSFRSYDCFISCCFSGSFVMKVTATDADEPWTLNSMISYTIINQNPPDDMFYINRDDGSIFVKKPLLEREV